MSYSFWRFVEFVWRRLGNPKKKTSVGLSKGYDDAWNTKDTASIERILAPGYVYFSSKGQVRSRQSLLEELLSPNYKLTFAERTELKVYLALGTAVVSSRWKGSGISDGEEFHDDQRCSIVLVRGTWMGGSIRALHANCCSLIVGEHARILAQYKDESRLSAQSLQF